MGFASSGSIGSVKLNNSFLSTVTEWSITGPQGDRTPLVASNTKRGNLSFVGAKSWSGSFTTNSFAPPIPGKKYAFVGYKGTHEDSFAGPTESGNIIITSLSSTIDFTSAAPLSWQINFQGDGALTEGVGSGAFIDTTPPSKLQAFLSTMTVLKDNGTEVDVSDWYLDNVSLSVSAGTSGGKATATSNGWKLYVPGPVDFTATLSIGSNSRAAINVDVGDRVSLDMTMLDGTRLILKWLQINSFGSVSVQNGSAENISLSLETGMDAYSAGSYGEFSVTPSGGNKIMLWPDPIFDSVYNPTPSQSQGGGGGE